MNRIILIGNGFDLAHGLDTRYTDFIDDYWENVIKEVRQIIHSKTFQNDELSIPVDIIKEIKDYNELKKGYRITFKNQFLKHISDETTLNNWVDIEEEYYKCLKDIANKKSTIYTDVKDLNSDFKKIEKLLEEYLSKNINGSPNNSRNLEIAPSIYSKILFKDLNEKGVEEIITLLYELKTKSDLDKKYQYLANMLKEIKGNNKEEFKKNMLEKRAGDGTNRIIEQGADVSYADDFYVPENVLLLNFNYTATESLYRDSYLKNSMLYSKERTIKRQTIHIHGELNNEQNPIIFGYGDELDDDYKTIEKLGNKYLEYIKSIEYSRTDNYKKLLSFIESDYYQVFVMGHSCGLSDRTLLNTLFEHDNCASIKPFYYEWDENVENADGSVSIVKKDNYIELVQNISRNFNDKVKMRDRVVNKTYCSALT